MTIDWLSATTDQRKHLYRVLKNEADRQREPVLKLWSGILQERVSADYDKTLRAGTFSRKSAGQIYNWLKRHAPQQALHLDEMLRSGDDLLPGQMWQNLIDAHRTNDGIRLLPRSPGGFEIVGLARDAPTPRVKLNEEFYLQIDCPTDGTIGAVQGFGGAWYTLPLQSDAQIIKAEKGLLELPIHPDTGAVDYLSEPSDIGLHEFLLILAAEKSFFEGFIFSKPVEPLSPMLLDQFALKIQTQIEPVILWRLRFTVVPTS